MAVGALALSSAGCSSENYSNRAGIDDYKPVVTFPMSGNTAITNGCSVPVEEHHDHTVITDNKKEVHYPYENALAEFGKGLGRLASAPFVIFNGGPECSDPIPVVPRCYNGEVGGTQHLNVSGGGVTYGYNGCVTPNR